MLNQALYVMKILSEEEMWNCSAVEVSMKLNCITLNESNNVMKASSAELQWIVEKLMYIACDTQSNIVFMIECLSQNLIDVRLEHIKMKSESCNILKNNKLWFEIQINIEHLYKSTQSDCVWLCRQQMWKCCELKIYYEICVHVEWWHHSMNVEEAMYISTSTTEVSTLH
jgi:hypothetical protein